MQLRFGCAGVSRVLRFVGRLRQKRLGDSRDSTDASGRRGDQCESSGTTRLRSRLGGHSHVQHRSDLIRRYGRTCFAPAHNPDGLFLVVLYCAQRTYQLIIR